MNTGEEKSKTIASKSLYVAIGALFLLMPYIAVLKHGFPIIKIGDTGLTSLIKDSLALYFIVLGALIATSAKKALNFDNFEMATGLLLAFATTKTLISTATFTQALNSFRHEFLFVVLSLVLYRLCRTRVLRSESIHKLFSKTLAINMVIVVLIGYAEIANKDILGILYGEQAMNLVTGIPGIPQIRSVSTLENPINLALFLTMCMTFFAATIPRVELKHAIIAITLLPLVISTFSRVFIVLYLFIFTILLIRHFSISTTFGKLGLASLAIIATASITNITSSSFQEIDVSDLIGTRIEQTLDSIQTKDDPRFGNWEAALQRLNSYPIIGSIGGIGLGLSNPGDFEDGQFRIENSFLTIYLQLGLFGLILYLMPIAIILKLAINGKVPNSGLRTLAITIIILIGGITNDTHRNMPFSFYLWITLILTFLWYKNGIHKTNHSMG